MKINLFIKLLTFEVTPGKASTAQDIPSEMSEIFSGETLNYCSFVFYNNPSFAISPAESSN